MEKNQKLVSMGQRIRALRKEKEMSQDELARLCGYTSRSSINKIEAGLNDIPQSKIKAIADALSVSPAWLMGYDDAETRPKPRRKGVKIPLLGTVAAGTPIEAVENIIGEEEIPENMARMGTFYALKVSGDSMEPTMFDGDTIIVLSTPTADTGDIAVVLVNGDEATVKEIHRAPEGVTLIGHNAAVYKPHFYSNAQIETLPVTIRGIVYEVRRELKKLPENFRFE